MKRTFPDYDGDASYEHSLAYIKQQFTRRITPAIDGSRRVHRTFVCNLMDPDAVTNMFQSVFTELKERLKSAPKR
jgi:hypothetical protein